MRTMPRCAPALLLAAALLLAVAAPAQANHHFLRITEVFAGTTAQPNAEFVELQASAAGQNVLTGKRLRVYDAAGTLLSTATFPANVATSAAQMTVLIGTTQAASYFGVTPDLAMTAGIPARGGRICWENTTAFVDCVAWGDYAGPDSGKGEANPVNPSEGIPAGKVLARDLSRGASPTLLNVPTPPATGDDENNSAADFDVVNFATPRNNAGALQTKAAAVSAPGGVLTYDSDAAGVNNRPTVTAIGGGDYRLSDTAAPVTAGAGCTADRVDAVTCLDPVSGRLSGGPGNDMITTGGSLPVTLEGEDGADRLRSSAGADTLAGGLGNDILTGGPGPDGLDGGEGADTLDGGPGADSATWAARTAGVVVDIDADADDGNDDDGFPGARDTTSPTIEHLVGGAGDDQLTGSTAANTFDGGAGSDTVTYAKRTATVMVDFELNSGGDPGVDGGGDVLLGIRNVVGGAGDDFLSGDLNANRMTGGKGIDDVDARGGNDIVLIRDAIVPDSADCGDGTDRIQADAGDTLTSCETPF